MLGSKNEFNQGKDLFKEFLELQRSFNSSTIGLNVKIDFNFCFFLKYHEEIGQTVIDFLINAKNYLYEALIILDLYPKVYKNRIINLEYNLRNKNKLIVPKRKPKLFDVLNLFIIGIFCDAHKGSDNVYDNGQKSRVNSSSSSYYIPKEERKKPPNLEIKE
ncbi:hypothetical protein BpHYR1_036235 [Brachionus plicatilis]|uniref:Uncharacterized protein n=1 Tax=Brachionus plicatilis TaxID=10195 RepID=A0A3M7QV30_BRAPC|nr:hypothetical protein BpHYR1_036235 [Brachionus plicatilis]